MSTITLEDLLKKSILLQGYTKALLKNDINVNEEEQNFLIAENQNFLEQIDTLILNLKSSEKRCDNLSEKIDCDFAENLTSLIKKNLEFKQNNNIPLSPSVTLFNITLEVIGTEDRWIQSIKDAKIEVIANCMRRNLVIYNDEITETIAEERNENIDNFAKYSAIESHFQSSFFEIYDLIKEDKPLVFLEKVLNDMDNIPQDKIDTLFTLVKIQSHIDYYTKILSNLDLDTNKESLDIHKLLESLPNLTITPLQRITRYGSLFQEIDKNLPKFINQMQLPEKYVQKLQDQLKSTIEAAQRNTQNLNKETNDIEKEYAEKALGLIKKVIETTDWDIKMKKLFGRSEVLSGTSNITSFMKKMLTEINTLDQKVDNEYKIALGNAREGMGVDKEKVRYDVIISTLKNISSIAKSTETSTHHKILSKTLQKDGPNVKAFYNNVKAMRSEDGCLNIAIATELMSPFLDSKIEPNQLRLPGLKI